MPLADNQIITHVPHMIAALIVNSLILLTSLPAYSEEYIIDHGNTLLRAHTSPFPELIDAECRKHMENPPNEQIYGCALTNGDICTVYAVNPGIGYPPMYYFHHEVWHCLFPDFHPKPGQTWN